MGRPLAAAVTRYMGRVLPARKVLWGFADATFPSIFPPERNGRPRRGLQEMTHISTQKMPSEDVLRAKLDMLRQEHRDLDEAIRALEDRQTSDALTIRRLKKQKLGLKDQITLLEDQITPDIIA